VRKIGLGLQEYRAHIGTWHVRVALRSAVSQVGTRGDKTFLGAMTLCAAVIATLLVIGGSGIKPRTCGQRCESLVQWL